MQSTAKLFEFFANPIVRVSQMLARHELDDDSSNEYWSSEVPVLVFTVEGTNGERSIAIAGDDTRYMCAAETNTNASARCCFGLHRAQYINISVGAR